jgi:UDP-glucose 4-epimerase
LPFLTKKYEKGENHSFINPGLHKRNFTHGDDIFNVLIFVGENSYGDELGIMLLVPKGNSMNVEVITAKPERIGWKTTRSIEK